MRDGNYCESQFIGSSTDRNRSVRMSVRSSSWRSPWLSEGSTGTGEFMARRSPVAAVLRLVAVCALAAAVTVVTLVVTPGTAYACTCVVQHLSQRADEVDVAFIGTEVSRTEYEEQDGWPRAALVFRVGRVYKGDIGPLVEVHTNAGGPACGLYRTGLPAGPVVAYREQGALRTSSCSSERPIAELFEAFGTAYHPDPSIGLHIEDEVPVEDEHAGSDPSDASPVPPAADVASTALEPQAADVTSTPVWTLVGVVAGSVAAVVILGTLIVLRRRHRSASAVSSPPDSTAGDRGR